MAHFQDLVVQELFPASRQVWEFNLCHTPSTVITLREAPLKVVSELEVTELALAIAMVSDCLPRFHPRWVPRVNGVPVGRIKVLAVWKVLRIGWVQQAVWVEVKNHAIIHFNAVVELLALDGH